MFLKKIRLKKKNLIFIFLSLILSSSIFADEKNYKQQISNYFLSIENFSANFIQHDEIDIEEGAIYLNKKINRIKVDYLEPKEITIILSKKKAMYINFDLEEVEYFNPTNTLANAFFEVFYDISFFENTKMTEGVNTLKFKKDILSEDKIIKISVIFEKKPFVIKQIKLESDGQKISMTLLNPNFNATFSDNFFSLANPLLN